jgi:hypothetical protein
MTITHPAGRQRREVAGEVSDLARRKLEAFARIEHDFMASFRFVEEVHGQRRFAASSVADTVRYLRALSICERKDLLLSVPNTIHRYEGARSLELLRDWQEGHTAGVVAFLQHRLGEQPFGELSQRIEVAEREKNTPAAERLAAGRAILLNRLFTLASALEAIFALEPKRLRAEVRAACKRLDYTRAEIERHIADQRLDIYTYAPHPALARRNMLLMNHISAMIVDASHAQRPAHPFAPYAETVIAGEATQLSLRWRP